VRQDGYVPIEDYAVVGDGRTVALIARDGSVDWLCVPDVDSPSVFGAILDAERGGRFVLQPEGEFSAKRRYVEDTNVLETTYRTPSGAAGVLDAMTLGADGTLAPLREFVRRIEGLSGTTRFVWSFEPRFDYGRRLPRLKRRAGRIVAADGKAALALGAFGVPDASIHESSAGGRFELRQGETALLVFPPRDTSRWYCRGQPMRGTGSRRLWTSGGRGPRGARTTGAGARTLYAAPWR
jgi:GH15 family glucan-1,4-alpha-glucosidase